MDEQKAKELLDKYANGQCTAEEIALLEKWYGQYERPAYTELPPTVAKEQLERIRKHLQSSSAPHTSPSHTSLIPTTLPRPSKRLRVWKTFAAAAVLLMVGTVVFLNLDQKESSSSIQQQAIADLAPGSNRATLRLVDGRRIPLSENQSGIVINEESIRYADGTQLPDKIAAAAYAVLETPQGGQYQITLPDGTKVWLNAASTLQYFTSAQPKRERRVILSGEAYFEVAKMEKLPFIVETHQQEIQVWGTHFNVTAYNDETTTKTTLLEGSVSIQVKGKTTPVYLKPHQQAETSGSDIRITPTTTEAAVAWKNGYFMFDDEPIESIMRKISRWYNVDIIFKNINKNQVFTGTVSRFEQVSKVLEKLELTGGVQFEIETGTAPGKERRIIVMP